MNRLDEIEKWCNSECRDYVYATEQLFFCVDWMRRADKLLAGIYESTGGFQGEIAAEQQEEILTIRAELDPPKEEK